MRFVRMVRWVDLSPRVLASSTQNKSEQRALLEDTSEDRLPEKSSNQ